MEGKQISPPKKSVCREMHVQFFGGEKNLVEVVEGNSEIPGGVGGE